MTSDADRSTALDDAIDEVARAMTPRVVPDLRARIAEGLHGRHVSFPSWQPALAAAMVLVALVAWWVKPEPARVSEAPPIVEAPVTRSPESPRVQEPVAASTQRSTR